MLAATVAGLDGIVEGSSCTTGVVATVVVAVVVAVGACALGCIRMNHPATITTIRTTRNAINAREFILLFLEIEAHRIYTISFPGRFFGTVVENVSEVRATTRAGDLGAGHAGVVFAMRLDSAGKSFNEGWPASSGILLRGLYEERGAANLACVHPDVGFG